MSRPRIVVFATDEVGHFQRLVPLMAGLCRRGARVDVFTHARFRAAAERTGASFFDLFDGCPQDGADVRSHPMSCRGVTFAGCYADSFVGRLAADRPALIMHDTFAVIGHVVGRVLGVPYVNVCAGHDVQPAAFLATLATDPRVAVAPECHAAVERLRTHFGIAEASPFSYVTALSPVLNVYCEPPEYLTEHARSTFAPVEYFGSLENCSPAPRRESSGASCFGTGTGLKIFVSFGTVVWRYYAAHALAALQVITAELSARPGVRTLVSLGGHPLDPAARATLEKPGVRVVSTASQRDVLAEADAFVTHHGLNSTHESVYHRVPMLGYPFFWDQPGLAARCRQFGISLPLAATLRAPLQRDDVGRALDELAARSFLQPALAAARHWELAVMAGRERVFDRLLNLADTGVAA